MADELKVMARKLSQPIKGDFVPYQGAHIRPATALVSIDVGNSETFVVPAGTDYLDLRATVDLWFRISAAGSNAEVDYDQFIGAGERIQIGEVYESGAARKIKAGDVVKCVAES
jgi:hypothetical protein